MLYSLTIVSFLLLLTAFADRLPARLWHASFALACLSLGLALPWSAQKTDWDVLRFFLHLAEGTTPDSPYIRGKPVVLLLMWLCNLSPDPDRALSLWQTLCSLCYATGAGLLGLAAQRLAGSRSAATFTLLFLTSIPSLVIVAGSVDDNMLQIPFAAGMIFLALSPPGCRHDRMAGFCAGILLATHGETAPVALAALCLRLWTAPFWRTVGRMAGIAGITVLLVDGMVKLILPANQMLASIWAGAASSLWRGSQGDGTFSLLMQPGAAHPLFVSCLALLSPVNPPDHVRLLSFGIILLAGLFLLVAHHGRACLHMGILLIASLVFPAIYEWWSPERWTMFSLLFALVGGVCMSLFACSIKASPPVRAAIFLLLCAYPLRMGVVPLRDEEDPPADLAHVTVPTLAQLHDTLARVGPRAKIGMHRYESYMGWRYMVIKHHIPLDVLPLKQEAGAWFLGGDPLESADPHQVCLLSPPPYDPAFAIHDLPLFEGFIVGNPCRGIEQIRDAPKNPTEHLP